MLDKAIEHGKEHRKRFYRAKYYDRSCRCHGGCKWCEGNRLFQFRKAKSRVEYVEYMEDDDEGDN